MKIIDYPQMVRHSAASDVAMTVDFYDKVRHISMYYAIVRVLSKLGVMP